jgi:ribosomal protein S18 acetylase RimI-like enzyme
VSVTLRDYVQEDAASVDALAVSAFRQYSGDFNDWPAMAARLGKTSKLAGVSQIIIAEEGGKIVGAVGYLPPHSPKLEFFKPEWPLIRSLVVDPAARGRGIGRMLAEECIARARRDDAAEIALHTSPIMQVALPMYLRMGFTRYAAAPPLFGVPYDIYVKKLN